MRQKNTIFKEIFNEFNGKLENLTSAEVSEPNNNFFPSKNIL